MNNTDQFFQQNPQIKLVWKDASKLMKFINMLMHLGSKNHPFMLEYATTIGKTIYMPNLWWDTANEQQRLILLRHELVHIKQMQQYSTPLFLLLYLFVPLPLGCAYFRAKFEKDAYRETMQARYEYWGEDSITSTECREWIISQFTGKMYGWMWPFKQSMERWYKNTSQGIIKSS